MNRKILLPVLIILLLIAILVVVLSRSGEKGERQLASYGPFNLTYFDDEFAPASKESELCALGSGQNLYCLEYVDQRYQSSNLVGAAVIFSEQVDFASEDQCLSPATADVSESEIVTLAKEESLPVVAFVNLDYAEEGKVWQQNRYRVFYAAKCYEASHVLVYNQVGTQEVNQLTPSQKQTLTEVMQDVIKSMRTKANNDPVLTSLVEEVRAGHEEKFKTTPNVTETEPEPDMLTDAGVAIGEKFSLPQGYVGLVEELLEDSRCPIDVTCVWAGTVKIRAVFTSSVGNEEIRTLTLNETQTITDGLTITLVRVEPPLQSNARIGTTSYRFFFDINNQTVVEPEPMKQCVRAGCSNQLCVDSLTADEIVTTCEFREEYACYQAAECEIQADGECGFTPSEELSMCLAEVNAED